MNYWSRKPGWGWIAALMAMVFAADVFTPLGMIPWTLYVLPLIVFFRFSGRRHLPHFAAIVTGLIALGHFLSPPGAPAEYSVFNRSIGIFALWIVISLLSRIERGRERRYAEEALRESEARRRLQRQNNLYEAISQTNQAVVRLTDRETLFREICRIAVEHGKLRMAWIGWLDPETLRVIPLVSFGAGQDYLYRVRLFADPQRPEARGLAGIAMQEGRIYICNDLPGDPLLVSIREEVARAGFRSGAAFPLRHGGRVVGALTLFSGELHFFDGQMERLLEEMAGDISFALENFEKEARRREAEERLRKLSHVVEQSPASVIITRPDGRIEYVNPRFIEITGYALEEVIGKTPAVVKSGSTPAEIYADLWRTIRAGGEWRGELQNRKKNQELFWEHEIISPLKNELGETTHFVSIREDISSLRHAEQALRRLNRSLRMLSDCNQVLVHAQDEQELLDTICGIIVEVGDLRLAWVGYAERDAAQSVRPIACRGIGEEYVRQAQITWADTERGQGPTGTAIRTGTTVVMNDILTHSGYELWREQALRHGYASSVALPLKSSDGVFGALNVYSSAPDFFDPEEVTLLNELAADLAYGIVSLRTAARRERAEEALRALSIEQQSILENAGVGIAFLKERRITRCNRKLAEIFGYSVEELIGRSVRILHVSEESFERTGREAYLGAEMGGRYAKEVQYRKKDGSVFWASINLTILDLREPAKGVVCVIQDIEQRKRSERSLLLARRAIESSSNGILICDMSLRDSPVVYVNPAFERITGYPADEIIGRNPHFLAGKNLVQVGLEEIYAAVREQRAGSVILRNYRKDGSLFWNELSISPVRDESGSVTHFVGIFNDVTERIRYQEEIEHQATHDTLTGLANRTLLADRLDQAVVYAHRSGRLVAVLLLDLDRFKLINDGLGHNTGDTLLKIVAQRFASCIRKGDTIARLGGDEFVIILTDVAQEDDVAPIARKIIETLMLPLEIDGQEIFTTASIGISLYPKDGTDQEALLKNADTAMYRVKASGHNAYRFYTEDMNVRSVEKLKLEADLRRALERGEFLLHYQPVISLGTGEITGAEALLRWQSGSRGMVSPADFIPLAEETGLILPIGEWALRAACLEGRRLLDRGLPPIAISVNVSALQLRQKNFATIVRDALDAAGLSPLLLKIEITESAIMHNPEEAVAILAGLKSLGVAISVDDFGTGYSSLSYLRRFSIDQLKVDRSFVKDVATDPDSATIARTIVALAHNLRLDAVAEGVETPEQLAFLEDIGCDRFQGFLFSRPVPATDLYRLLAQS